MLAAQRMGLGTRPTGPASYACFPAQNGHRELLDVLSYRSTHMTNPDPSRNRSEKAGAMFSFQSEEGHKVYVDPEHVAFVEEREEPIARIVFSGGAELVV